jgi:hypothetical protein
MSRVIRSIWGSAWLIGVGLALMLASGGPVRAQDPSSELGSRDPKVFKICNDQIYALCFTASCFVQNGVSYCECDVRSGDSISLPFKFGKDEDVCSVNAEGGENGYMVSTYSLPKSVTAPDGDKALYDCPAGTSPYGAYAQCDGGICFKSTEGQSFPGFDKPLAKDQIICSCPITITDPSAAKMGFEIVGPYPCQPSYFNNCSSLTQKPKTGSTLYSGAPIGVPAYLTHLLYGDVPPLNRCRPPTSSKSGRTAKGPKNAG